MKTSRFGRGLIALVVLLAFVGWAAVYILQHQEDFRRLLYLPAGTLFFCGAALLASVLTNGVFFYLTARPFGVLLPVREWLALALATTSVNLVSPLRGGAGLRAWYMKERHGLSLTDFATTLGGVIAVVYLVHSVLGVLAMAALALRGRPFDAVVGLFYLLIALVLAVLTLQRLSIRERERFPWKQIAGVVNGWQRIRRDGSIFLRLVLACVLYYVISTLFFFAAFAGIGVKLHWSEAAFFNSASVMVAMIGLTPGGLGIQDGMSVYLSRSLPFTVSEALMVQILLRSLMLVILLVLSPPAFRFLGVRWSDASTH